MGIQGGWAQGIQMQLNHCLHHLLVPITISQLTACKISVDANMVRAERTRLRAHANTTLPGTAHLHYKHIAARQACADKSSHCVIRQPSFKDAGDLVKIALRSSLVCASRLICTGRSDTRTASEVALECPMAGRSSAWTCKGKVRHQPRHYTGSVLIEQSSCMGRGCQ